MQILPAQINNNLYSYINLRKIFNKLPKNTFRILRHMRGQILVAHQNGIRFLREQIADLLPYSFMGKRLRSFEYDTLCPMDILRSLGDKYPLLSKQLSILGKKML